MIILGSLDEIVDIHRDYNHRDCIHRRDYIHHSSFFDPKGSSRIFHFHIRTGHHTSYKDYIQIHRVDNYMVCMVHMVDIDMNLVDTVVD